MSESKKRDSGPDEEPRKPGRPEQRTSLAPLEFEEALRDLIAAGKPEEEPTPDPPTREDQGRA